MTVVDPVEGAGPILERLAPVVSAFAGSGFRFALVGGVVRDLALGLGDDVHDVDVTTDARPDDIKRLVAPVADAVWTQGERFGTIGMHLGDDSVEITTHRAEVYDETSRKPVVSFGDDLGDDLARRDFTINAMAVDGHTRTLVDPHHGLADLVDRRLRTPLSPEISFDDDPLRMLRAARFLARFDLAADPALVGAMTAMAARLGIVSAERIRDELDKLLTLDTPGPGLDLLAETGLAERIDPSWTPTALAEPALREPTPPVRVPRLDLRRALLVECSDDPAAALRALRWPGADIRRTERALVFADDLVTAGAHPSDRFIRSSMRSPGREAVDLAVDLVDARFGPAATDTFVTRLEELRELEELDSPAPPLDGREVMDRFDLRGPAVGEALDLLEEHRLDHGPLDHAAAIALLEARRTARSDPPGDER